METSKTTFLNILLFMSIFILLSNFAIAKELKVEKKVKEESISVGSEITIFLKFSNPFNQPLFIKIKDKNIFAGNGLNVECYEYTLPKEGEFSLEYEPITAFSSGKFTLDPAEITYKNPETGKEETIKSNELTLDIKRGNTTLQKNLQQKGVTTIYQCGGTSIRSTQYSSSGSSGSSFSFSFGGGGMSQNQQGTQQQQQPKSIQNRLNEMQQQVKQDMSSLKKNLQQEIKKKEEIKKELSEKIEKNEKFQKIQKELQKQDYSLQKKEIEPESNASGGKFNYHYSKGSKSVSIRGEMKDGDITKIQKWGDEERKRLKEKLEKDERFRELEKSLIEKGFQLSGKKLSFPEDNYSKFNYSYINPKKNETSSIIGKISLQGNVTEIKAVILEKKKNEGNKEEEIFSWLLFLLILLIIFSIFFAIWKYYLQRRRKITHVIAQTGDMEKENNKEDFRKIALRMIKDGEFLYKKGNKKEAYTKVSEGVRFYFKNIFEEREDLTDYEVINLLKKDTNKKKLRVTEECLSLCNLVKFAKYKPRDEDFHKIIRDAYEIIE